MAQVNTNPFNYDVILNASVATSGKFYFTLDGKRIAFCGGGFVTGTTKATLECYVGNEDITSIAPSALTDANYVVVKELTVTRELTSTNNFFTFQGSGIYRLNISNAQPDTISIVKILGHARH